MLNQRKTSDPRPMKLKTQKNKPNKPQASILSLPNPTTPHQNNRNEKKTNGIDISSHKLAKSHTKRPLRGHKRETLKEKLNLFY